jgi:hypothetical protein
MSSFEGITLTSTTVKHGRESGPVKGAMARVEQGANMRRRVTATRFVLTGPLIAFAAKKQVGSLYLTVEGEGYAFSVEVPAKKETDARKFAAKINSAASK